MLTTNNNASHTNRRFTFDESSQCPTDCKGEHEAKYQEGRSRKTKRTQKNKSNNQRDKSSPSKGNVKKKNSYTKFSPEKNVFRFTPKIEDDPLGEIYSDRGDLLEDLMEICLGKAKEIEKSFSEMKSRDRKQRVSGHKKKLDSDYGQSNCSSNKPQYRDHHGSPSRLRSPSQERIKTSARKQKDREQSEHSKNKPEQIDRPPHFVQKIAKELKENAKLLLKVPTSPCKIRRSFSDDDLVRSPSSGSALRLGDGKSSGVLERCRLLRRSPSQDDLNKYCPSGYKCATMEDLLKDCRGTNESPGLSPPRKDWNWHQQQRHKTSKDDISLRSRGSERTASRPRTREDQRSREKRRGSDDRSFERQYRHHSAKRSTAHSQRRSQSRPEEKRGHEYSRQRSHDRERDDGGWSSSIEDEAKDIIRRMGLDSERKDTEEYIHSAQQGRRNSAEHRESRSRSSRADDVTLGRRASVPSARRYLSHSPGPRLSAQDNMKIMRGRSSSCDLNDVSRSNTSIRNILHEGPPSFDVRKEMSSNRTQSRDRRHRETNRGSVSSRGRPPPGAYLNLRACSPSPTRRPPHTSANHGKTSSRYPKACSQSPGRPPPGTNRNTMNAIKFPRLRTCSQSPNRPSMKATIMDPAKFDHSSRTCSLSPTRHHQGRFSPMGGPHECRQRTESKSPSRCSSPFDFLGDPFSSERKHKIPIITFEDLSQPIDDDQCNQCSSNSESDTLYVETGRKERKLPRPPTPHIRKGQESTPSDDAFSFPRCGKEFLEVPSRRSRRKKSPSKRAKNNGKTKDKIYCLCDPSCVPAVNPTSFEDSKASHGVEGTLLSLLQKNCHKVGLKFRNWINPNGDCFFNAILDQLEFQGVPRSSASSLRRKLVSFMRQHRVLKGPKGDIDLPESISMPWEEYLEWIEHDRVWADPTAVVAMAHMLKRDILIVTNSPPGNGNCIWWVNSAPDFDGEPLTLGLVWPTWQSLQPISSNFRAAWLKDGEQNLLRQSLPSDNWGAQSAVPLALSETDLRDGRSPSCQKWARNTGYNIQQFSCQGVPRP